MVLYYNRIVANTETQDKRASSVTLNLCSAWLASLHFSATAFITQHSHLCLSCSLLISQMPATSALSS